MLERNIFPWLGNKPITDILPKDILECLRRVEDRGTIETVHRTLQICDQVFRYAVATGRAERDITPDLRGALPSAKGEHFAAITEPVTNVLTNQLLLNIARAYQHHAGRRRGIYLPNADKPNDANGYRMFRQAVTDLARQGAPGITISK
jgi:integrase